MMSRFKISKCVFDGIALLKFMLTSGVIKETLWGIVKKGLRMLG
jgi:hypothetical protein